jgi:uncharacterized membrane protein required for colicin V production
MISLNVMLFIFMILFALVGAMRGWAKELLVSFSIILALFTITILESYVPFFKNIVEDAQPESLFWVRTLILVALVFFGYQTPKIPKLAESGRFVRNFLQDGLLGGFLGAFNGYLIFGTIWYYLHTAQYPFTFVLPPDAATITGQAALRWINSLPPEWLMATPAIYFAVVICFVFVIVVFI